MKEISTAYRRIRQDRILLEGSICCAHGHIARSGPLKHHHRFIVNGPIIERISLAKPETIAGLMVARVTIQANYGPYVFDKFNTDGTEFALTDCFPFRFGGNEGIESEELTTFSGLNTARISHLELMIVTKAPLVQTLEIPIEVSEWMPSP